MKRTVSFVLLFSFLLSLLLIPSSAADSTYTDPYEGQTNVAYGATMAGGKNSGGWYNFKGVSGSNNITDGVKSHDHDKAATFLNLLTYATAAQLKAGTAELYDINGKTGNEALGEKKYLGIVGYRLTNTYTVDAVRVFLDEVASGEPCEHMLDGLEVAVSTTGADGSWTVVYSGANINCEKNFKIYEDKYGNHTAYVDARFDPIEALYFRVGVTATSCLHTSTPVDDGNLPWCRITEVELFKHVPLDTTYRTNAVLGNGIGSYKFYTVSGSNNITTGNRTHDHSNSKSFLTLATKTYPSDTVYDINGKTGTAGAKYVGYITYPFNRPTTVENIRVYLDEIKADGTPCEYMLDSMDIAVSNSGEDGSWKIVYSGSNIACEKKYMVYEDEDGNKTAYVEAKFDPTKALWVRIGIADTGCRDLTDNTTVLRTCRITEIEAWSVENRPVEGGGTGDDNAINSTMLFPLLMRHRQYETETTTTMFGLRVKHLLRSADAISFEKNGVKAAVPGASLKALDLAGSDKLVVTITQPSDTTVKVTATADGKTVDGLAGTLVTMPWDSAKGTEVKAVDTDGNATGATYDAASGTVSFIANALGAYGIVEGTAPDAPVIIPGETEKPEVKGTLYRWDFDDLNEKNGLNNLTDSAKSTKGYTIENGIITLTDRTTDFKMAETVSLDNWTDWSIEWRAKLDNSSALFGTEFSKRNFVYLAYTVSGWGLPFRMVDANNKAHMIKYGDYAAFNTEMNTWKAEFSSAMNQLTLKFFDEGTQAWEVVGSVTPSTFNFELTHMFGRYGEEGTNVCLNGQVDYIEVFIGE